MSVTLNFAKWAILLLSLMIVSVTVGVGLVVGSLVDLSTGAGSALIALGVTSGVAAKWVGEA